MPASGIRLLSWKMRVLIPMVQQVEGIRGVMLTSNPPTHSPPCPIGECLLGEGPYLPDSKKHLPPSLRDLGYWGRLQAQVSLRQILPSLPVPGA